MSPLPAVSRLFRLGRARAVPTPHDAADMGTAFGLDMAQPYPGIDQMPEAPAVPAAPTHRTGWFGRWTLRGPDTAGR